jgi:hypothetical protein
MRATILIRPAILTAVILLAPLVAMQITRDVVWSLGDFLIMGVLVFACALAYELIASRTRRPLQRAVAALAVGAVFVAIWLELAVGAVSKAFALL